MAMCEERKEHFGITVDPRQGCYAFVWAFKIKKEQARREGYDRTHVRGQVMYDDTPKEVFRHYKELEMVGLAAPQVTYFIHELKEKGWNVDLSATTVEEAKATILAALKE